MKKINNLKTGITHNGLFHADDVLATGILKELNPDINIIRTRNPALIEAHQNSDNSIVFDVGMGEYDHHQKDAKIREDGHKYAAVGLIYNDVKDLLFPDNLQLQQEFEDKIIKPVEHNDNGELENEDKNIVSEFVNNCIPAWNSDNSLDEAFEESVNLLQTAIKNIREHADIDHELTVLKDISDEKAKQLEQSHQKGLAIVEDIYNKAENKQIIELPHPGIPRDNLSEKDTVFTIYKTTTNQINIQAVPPEAGSFDQKIKIPSDLFNDLSEKIEGAQTNTFVHPAGFLAAIPLNDTISEQEAKEYLIGKAEELIYEKEHTLIIPEETSCINRGLMFTLCEAQNIEKQNITNISIPEKTWLIESNSFENCESLTSITIPERVAFIEEYAFFGCENLSHVKLECDISAISDINIFDYCPDDMEIELNDGSVISIDELEDIMNKTINEQIIDKINQENSEIEDEEEEFDITD